MDGLLLAAVIPGHDLGCFSAVCVNSFRASAVWIIYFGASLNHMAATPDIFRIVESGVIIIARSCLVPPKIIDTKGW